MIDPDEAYMALNELRLIVLMEHPKGHFEQVALNQEQFKKISEAIVAHTTDEEPPPDFPREIEMVCIHYKENWTLPGDTLIGLSSITPHECDREDEIKHEDEGGD